MIVPGRVRVEGRLTDERETARAGWGWRVRERHRFGWSHEVIEAARVEEIQKINRLIAGGRTVARGSSGRD